MHKFSCFIVFMIAVFCMSTFGCKDPRVVEQPTQPYKEEFKAEATRQITNVLKSFYEEEDINGRLKWVAEPERTRPYMEDYYKAGMDQYDIMAGAKLLSIRYNMPLDRFGRPFTHGAWHANVHSVMVQVQSPVDDYKKTHEVTYPIRVTYPNGVSRDGSYRIDWMGKFVGRKMGVKQNGVKEITAKQLETGVNQIPWGRVHWKLLWTRFDEINNDSIDLLPSVRIEINGLTTKYDKSEADEWFGFRVWDKTEKSFPFLFAKKSEFLDEFLEFDQYDRLNIKGVVVELEDTNSCGIIVTEVEKMDF